MHSSSAALFGELVDHLLGTLSEEGSQRSTTRTYIQCVASIR